MANVTIEVRADFAPAHVVHQSATLRCLSGDVLAVMSLGAKRHAHMVDFAMGGCRAHISFDADGDPVACARPARTRRLTCLCDYHIAMKQGVPANDRGVRS